MTLPRLDLREPPDRALDPLPEEGSQLALTRRQRGEIVRIRARHGRVTVAPAEEGCAYLQLRNADGEPTHRRMLLDRDGRIIN